MPERRTIPHKTHCWHHPYAPSFTVRECCLCNEKPCAHQRKARGLELDGRAIEDVVLP
jgi:hypothetical protein